MITVCRKPIIVTETVEMLYKLANGISFETVKSDFVRKYTGKRDEGWKQAVYKKTAALSKIMAEACVDLDQNNPTLHYYFGGYTSAASSAKCCLGQIVTWILGAYDTDFETHILNLKKAWRAKIENHDPIMLSPGISFQYAKDVPWAVDLAENIDSLQYPEEFRWRLFKLISNTDYYIDELAEFMRPIAKRLSDALESHAREMEDVYEYWEEYFKSHSCSDFALAFCNVETTFPADQNIRLYVSFMNATSAVSEMETNNTSNWYVHVGCLLDAGISYDTRSLLVDEICEVLKVLSDKSKFVILQKISDAPAYGTELADQMGLTNATISRHMNTLYNCGFITAEKSDTRIFYKTNKEHLAKFLRTLSDQLMK